MNASGTQKLLLAVLAFSYLFAAWEVAHGPFATAVVAVPLLLLGALVSAAGFAYHCSED